MTNNKHIWAIVMAGGLGSRFWPVSGIDCPKQFVDTMGVGRSMLQLTFERMEKLCPRDHVIVVTGEQYTDRVREQVPGLLPWQVLGEPLRRNTAPCIAYASWRIKALNPQANIVVTPADHIVMNVAEFRRVVVSALNFTAETDSIVTLGMKPTRPETGYGYIQADLSVASARNREVYRVDSFHEKPELSVAEKYVKHKNFFWNSGIFLFRVQTIVNALRIYTPEISQIFEPLLPVYGTPEEQETINREFPKCPNISIDYAVMEKSEEIFVFPASFGWSDLGTWGSLHEQSVKDGHENVCIGQRIELHDTNRCIVHTQQEKRVIIQGLDGFIVAEKDNTLLICRRDEEQRIRQFVEE